MTMAISTLICSVVKTFCLYGRQFIFPTTSFLILIQIMILIKPNSWWLAICKSVGGRYPYLNSLSSLIIFHGKKAQLSGWVIVPCSSSAGSMAYGSNLSDDLHTSKTSILNRSSCSRQLMTLKQIFSLNFYVSLFHKIFKICRCGLI